jgi:hypothetical protein
MVDLLSIDQPTYDYFSTMNNLLASATTRTRVAPINPTTNIANGALGYFTAYSISSKIVIFR